MTRDRDALRAEAAPPPDPAPQEPSASAARTAGQVDAALSRAPGLGAGPERAALRQRLIAGDCPPDALEAAYGEINRQTLLALITELGTCN